MTTKAVPWLESDFESWLTTKKPKPYVLELADEQLLVVRTTRNGGRKGGLRGRLVDVIALDRTAGLVILEVKNESAGREALGQALEYLARSP